MKNRGRIQAQGERLEASEAWAQNAPVVKNEALNLLDKVKNKIPRRAAAIRNRAFIKAARFINNGPYQVVDRIICKTFKVPDTEQERVDVEIQKGRAFE